MQSEWRTPKSIPFFIVSRSGAILVKDTMKPARISDNGHGYLQVQIMREGKRYTRYVHRLVAECFLDNPLLLAEINHKDGDKSNNSADNLEWCSRSENMKHAYRTGLKANTTDKQREAARQNAIKSRKAMREGWLKWSKKEEAHLVWMKNLEKADRWNKKGA